MSALFDFSALVNHPAPEPHHYAPSGAAFDPPHFQDDEAAPPIQAHWSVGPDGRLQGSWSASD
jgi:hypothetical protein